MKKSFTFIFIFLFATLIFSQSPSKLNYQGVVRNSSNALVSNSAVGIKMSIKQGSATGTTVYSETHTKTTNENGLFTLEIGTGTVLNGTFSNIDWSNAPFYLTSDVDLTGGTNYTLSNTSQMMSVPYALYAEKSGTSTNSSSSSEVSFLPGSISNIQTKIITNLSTTPYTIPTGKKFLVYAGFFSAGSNTSIGGGSYGNASSSTMTIPYNTWEIFVNNSGTTISSNNNSNTFLGYLIDENLLISSSNYTVPSGKTLVIIYASTIKLDGVSLTQKINVLNGGTPPLIVNAGTVVTSGFIGFLK